MRRGLARKFAPALGDLFPHHFLPVFHRVCRSLLGVHRPGEKLLVFRMLDTIHGRPNSIARGLGTKFFDVWLPAIIGLWAPIYPLPNLLVIAGGVRARAFLGFSEFVSVIAVERVCGLLSQLRDPVPVAPDELRLVAAEFARSGVVAFSRNVLASSTSGGPLRSCLAGRVLSRRRGKLAAGLSSRSGLRNLAGCRGFFCFGVPAARRFHRLCPLLRFVLRRSFFGWPFSHLVLRA